MNKNVLMVALCSSLAVGCSGLSTSEQSIKHHLQAKQIVDDAKQEKAQTELSMVPEWVIHPPKNDAHGVFAVGIGESYKLSNALKKSSIDAQYELAKSLKQTISGSEQGYYKDTNTDNDEQYTLLIDSIVDSVPVTGYDTIDQKLVLVDGKYTAYKLLKLSYYQFNKSLEMNTTKNEATEAFNELKMRLKEKSTFE